MRRVSEILPRITVGVLTWNKREDILELLDSLHKIRYDAFDIVVVDNNSADGTVEAIRSQYPDVHLFSNECNIGTAGFNRAMQFAFDTDAEFLFILEDGTTVHPDILKELLAVADTDDKIGVVSPKVYRYDKPDTIWMARGAHLNMRLCRHYGYVMNVLDDGSYDTQNDFDVFPGGFVFVRKSALAQAGMFDPDYFLYRDDDDWCLKVKQAGWRLVYAPKAKVWHKPSKSVGMESPAFYYYRTRNRLLFMKKNARLSEWLFFLPYFAVEYVWYIIYPLMREKRWPQLAGSLRGIYDFCRGKFGCLEDVRK